MLNMYIVDICVKWYISIKEGIKDGIHRNYNDTIPSDVASKSGVEWRKGNGGSYDR